MEVVIKVSVLAMLGAIAIGALRRSLPEMSVVLSITLVSALVFSTAGAILKVITLIFELSDWAGIERDLVEPLVKTLGISIVARLASDMCRESGVSAASSYIELVGGGVAISFSIPLVFGLLGQISQ